MPSPIRERYQYPGLTRLPCDDRKVADRIEFEDFAVYCTDKNDRINLKLQGAGEIFTIDASCEEFMQSATPNGQSFNWDSVQNLLLNRNPGSFD